jgi:hypothetical protein
MAEFNQNIDQAKDLLNLEQKDMNKLPSMLNVLTILTYIGCAFGAISSIWGYFSAAMSYKVYQNLGTNTETETKNKAIDSILSSAQEIVKKAYDNRLMILVFGLAGIVLCFYGAMQMRNLKKQGYLIYVIGELLPIVSFAAFIGFGNLLGGISMVLTSLFAIVFIILYTTQRKELVN